MAQQDVPVLLDGVGDDGVEQIHNRALSFLRQWELPPKPYAYEVSYVYFEGSNKRIVNASIDEAIGKSNTLSDYEVRQIHDALHRDSGPEIWTQLTDEMLNVHNLIERQSYNSDQFSKSLDRRKQQISNVTTVDQFREMISGLVDENERILKETKNLRAELSHSSEQISELTNKLEEARSKELEDELTRIGNRRYFNESLQREHAAAERDKTRMCLVMADIDRFKAINDTYGHTVGDAVLCFLARLIESNIKGKDHVARFGGEEFAVILPETDLRSAVKLIDKIRRDVQARNIVVVEDDLDIGRITVSFGVAELEPGQNIETLIKLADEKLYEAKRSGRNCVKF
ncbi:MAG: GGDEF domain-containing protein [Nitratireductor sp.]|nr:GGDEF domain-containing protein [Nitratireductor sp.]